MKSGMSLRSIWAAELTPGEGLMLEYPCGHQLVLTQVAITGGCPAATRAVLSASVETLLLDRPKVNGEIPSVQSEPVLAVFVPNDHPLKSLSLVFTYVNICFLQATGARLTVSGHIEKSTLKLEQVSEAV
jgi:hypothetical protein